MKRITALPKRIFGLHLDDDKISNNKDSCFISILDIDNNENKYDLGNDNFIQVKMNDIEEDIFVDGILKYQKPSDNQQSLI